MAAFSLSTFFGNMFHLRPNQLGHSTIGNAIVGAVDNVVDPMLGILVSNATGGLVNPVATPPSAAAPTSTELSIDTVIALFLQALVNSHNQAVVASAAPVVPPVVVTKGVPLPIVAPTFPNTPTGVVVTAGTGITSADGLIAGGING
jgi:hypothetical protein